MKIERQIFVRDSIRINILKDILNDHIKMFLKLDEESEKNYKEEIHEESKRVYVFGSINISEDSTGEYIVIRPVALKSRLVIRLEFEKNQAISGKNLLILSAAAKDTDNQIALDADISVLEIFPENDRYLLKITKQSAQSSPVQPQPKPVQNPVSPQPVQTTQNRQEVIDRRMKAAVAESHKNYVIKQEEFQELCEKYQLDRSIVEYYKDQEVKPIEKILADMDQLIAEAEKQIRLFINARQNKTLNIETEIKSNKGQ